MAKEESSSRGSSKSRTPVLDNFSKDITRLADSDELELILERNEILESLELILNRRRKSNVILIGYGIERTAIINSLALRIRKSRNIGAMGNYRILQLDIAALYAGTKYRGQLEERAKAVMNELEKDKDTIVFIEDINDLFRTSYSESNFNVYNILDKALIEGYIKFICCATSKDYLELEKSNPAFKQVFQTIKIQKCSIDETVDIINTLKSKYEEFHNVIFTEEIIKECIEMSDLYISHNQLPEKAIDLLDEVGAEIFIRKVIPREIKEHQTKIREIRELKNQAVKNKQYEKAADLRDDESKLERLFEIEKEKWNESLKSNKTTVELSDLINVIHRKTNIPKDIIREKKKYYTEEKNIEDDEYYKEKIKEFDLNDKAHVKIYNIPVELKTSLQQYILFFREYISRVKGKDIFFDVSVIDEGLRLDFESKELEDFDRIQDWFNEYIDYIRVKSDKFSVNFESEVDENESNMVMAELKNQIRFMESQVEILQLKIQNITLSSNSIKQISMSVSDKQKKLITRGYSDINQFRIELKEKVRKGEIKSVFDDLLNYLKDEENGESMKLDEVIIINSRFSELELKSRTGMLSVEDEGLEKNKITNSLIEFINRLD